MEILNRIERKHGVVALVRIEIIKRKLFFQMPVPITSLPIDNLDPVLDFVTVKDRC